MQFRSTVAGEHSGLRLAPNIFSISFGICGLAQCWSAGHEVASVPAWPADALWILAAMVWGVTLVAYVANAARTGRLSTQFTDATFAPFIAVAFIVPMLLGVRLAAEARTVGVAVFFVSLVLTVAFGGWISGQWIVADTALAQWHPGYLLPTVAAGLIAAAGSATLGYHSFAEFMFGYGVICWLVIGSIVLARLFTQPMLTAPLVPTMAIEVAPPVVAGGAWFAINGDRADAFGLALAGYALLMVLVQLRLSPLYARVPFAPSWWAFSFSYAAVITVGIRWLAVSNAPHTDVWTAVLLAVATVAMSALLGRTALGLWRGTFLPRVPVAESRQLVSGAPDGSFA